jgi:hypothetical protein
MPYPFQISYDQNYIEPDQLNFNISFINNIKKYSITNKLINNKNIIVIDSNDFNTNNSQLYLQHLFTYSSDTIPNEHGKNDRGIIVNHQDTKCTIYYINRKTISKKSIYSFDLSYEYSIKEGITFNLIK